MIVLAYLGSQCTKFHAAGWKGWFLLSFYLGSCVWPDAISRWIQQRVCIKFCVKVATETLAMIRHAVHRCLSDLLSLTALNYVKTSPRTLVTKELVVASRQYTVSHFLFRQGISDQKQHGCCSPPTLIFCFPNCIGEDGAYFKGDGGQ
jgi:hypothetical protein